MGIPPNRSTLVPQRDAGLVGNQKLIQEVSRNWPSGFNAGLKADEAEPIIPATELPRLVTRMVQDKPDIRNSNLELMDRATIGS